MRIRKGILTFYIVWLSLLVLIPFIIMCVLAFTSKQGLAFSNLTFSLDSFKQLFSPLYFEAYKNSIILSFIATFFCLLIGYPTAYILNNLTSSKLRNTILTMLILPMWSNMLLRIMGWEILFSPKSILNIIGISLDLIGQPIAIIIGMVSIYLPLMVFPIYTSLHKIDP
ncbi:MAG: ABC transporter permease, partial [Bacilli bacterium]